MCKDLSMVYGGVLALVLGILAARGDDQSTFGGFLGCRFSSVCKFDEECVDDRLFGNCQKENRRKDHYEYFLDHSTLQKLEISIERLLEEGYTWNNVLTQCVLGNILLSYRRGISPDPDWCNKIGIEDQGKDQEVIDDTTNILEKYFVDHYSSLRNNELPALSDRSIEDTVDIDYPNGGFSGPSQKKDEFVTIHKYFSKEKPNVDKRYEGNDILYPASSSEENFVGDDADGLGYSPLTREDGLGDGLDDLLARMEPQDLAAVKMYLSGVDDGGRSQLMNMPAQQDIQIENRGDGGWEDTEQAEGPLDVPDMVSMNNEPLRSSEILADELLPPGDDMEQQGGSNEMSLSPPDAKVLSDLIEERISVNDLSQDESERLLQYVDGMLADIQEEKPDQTEPDIQVLHSEEVKRTGENEIPDKKEQMPHDSLSNPSGNAHIKVMTATHKRDPLFEQAASNTGNVVAAADSEVSEPEDDHHDHHFEDSMVNTHTDPPKFDFVDGNYAFVKVKAMSGEVNTEKAQVLIAELEQILGLPDDSLHFNKLQNDEITFEVDRDLNATAVANLALANAEKLQNTTGLTVTSAGIGKETKVSVLENNGPKYFVLTFVLCGCIAAIVLAVITLYIVRRHHQSKEKLAQLAGAGEANDSSKDYQDLCRQRMQSKSSEKPEPLNAASRVGSVSTSEGNARSPSGSRSSTSSWSEEPVQSNMDISTGHVVLSYMEDHLKNKDRLDEEWEGLCAYEAEPNAITVATEPSNMRRNRYSDILPYDHSRVVLSSSMNVSGSDFINATTITDHDPRNPAYIATQGPLPHTVADFWQMVWEQGSVVIVMLTKLTENGVAMCHRYWPEEGSDLYHTYEVHLVSEHIWCDDYLVRSFYLKNLQTNETRTVTQFHFLTWPDLGIPASTKALLDFRRKVNKSYRGRSCPIVVHCSDGVGRTGTYSTIDMVLNRLSKGAKEIDIAATLEHIRDQRMNVVKTKEQFEFALASVAEEVNAILKALPQ
jgi:protein tyrosine phosphatase